MYTLKCDICKKEVNGEHAVLEYIADPEFGMGRRHHVCKNCGKPIFSFIQKKGWAEKEQ